MNRYRSFAFILALALSLTTLPAAGQGFFTGKFSAAQETHAVTSTATGTAVAFFEEGDLSFFITVEGLSGPITGAHFHGGAPGVNGSVVFDITNSFSGTTATGRWSALDVPSLTPALVADLFAGNLYLNVHTMANPAGEIRAQLIHTDGATLTADLTPEQESHDVTSDARGTAIVQLSRGGAAFFVSVDGLSGPITGAHFHNAAAGVDGGVERDITTDFDGGTAAGLWTDADPQSLTVDLINQALLGNLYLNIHTAANVAGEVRGQLNLTSGWGFQASLDPSQETEVSTGTGFGTASLTLSTMGLVYDITVTDLTGPITGAHFHNAPAGMAGPVVHPITSQFVGNSASGVWGFDDVGGLTEELIDALLSDELYLNIHTSANMAGEIRGQILPGDGTLLAARLTPEQETAEVTQEARGTAFASLTDAGVTYEITVDGLTGDITGAHFHRAPVGVNGGVVKAITSSFTGNHATGTWTATDAIEPLTDDLISALVQGELYLNIHTMANAPGEIRGQVLLSAGTAVRANLSSDQETMEVTQGALGTSAAVLTDAGLVYQATVEGLSGPVTIAHFHNAALGEDGGVEHDITADFTGNTAAGFWPTGASTLSEALRDEVLAGNIYLNVHTAANMPGELRGQTRIASGIGSGIEMSAGQENHVVTSDGRGTGALTFAAEGLLFDITVDNLTGPITGAHFHNAPLGMNSGVVRAITDDFTGSTAFGVWRASDSQPFSVDRTNELIAGNLYINIHTAANTGGEIRGQIGVGELVATAIELVDDTVPQSFRLSQNYPNPFNPSTAIAFDLTRSSDVRLEVFNALGQLVRTLANESLAPGSYEVTFNAASLPSGVYTYSLTAEGRSETKMMVLLK